LTTLITTDIATVSAIDAPLPKKRSLLPLLTVLFLISYALMTLLIVEQAATIESQRALIRELFRDSTELSAMKMKAQQDVAQHAQKAPVTQTPSTQVPSTRVPSTQAPTKQAPSSQAVPQHRTKNQPDQQKPQFQPPSRPASDIVDETRAVITI
jgi:hypothetical protein